MPTSFRQPTATSPLRWAAVLEAWLELFRAAILIRTPLRRHLAAQPAPRFSCADPAAPCSFVKWAIERAASHHVKNMTCLERAIATANMLRRRGVAGVVRLGVRSEDGRFDAHAWVELNGKPLEQGIAFVPVSRAAQ